MSRSDSQVFVESLLPKRHGFPQWIPEPHGNLPAEYQETGDRPGDVLVLMEDGVRDYQFNIFAEANDPINRNRVPSGFKPLSANEQDLVQIPKYHKSGTQISNFDVKKISSSGDISATIPCTPTDFGAGYEFKSTRSTGAALVLPEGASRINYEGRQRIQEYIEDNAKGWFEYVNGVRGRQTRHLYLVTGCDKTSDWGVTSYSTQSRSQEVCLKFTTGMAGVGASHSWSASSNTPAAFRCSEPSPTKVHNQCVFIRGFTITQKGFRPFSKSTGGIKISDICESKPWKSSSRWGSRSFSSGSNRSSQSSSSSNSPSSSFSPPTSTYSSPAPSPCPSPAVTRSTSWETLPTYADLDETPFTDSESECDDSDDEDSDFTVNRNELYHPSRVINEYLLESVENATFAVTHDNDWCSLEMRNPEDICDANAVLRCVKDTVDFNVFSNGYIASLKRGPTQESRADLDMVATPIRQSSPYLSLPDRSTILERMGKLIPSASARLVPGIGGIGKSAITRRLLETDTSGASFSRSNAVIFDCCHSGSIQAACNPASHTRKILSRQFKPSWRSKPKLEDLKRRPDSERRATLLQRIQRQACKIDLLILHLKHTSAKAGVVKDSSQHNAFGALVQPIRFRRKLSDTRSRYEEGWAENSASRMKLLVGCISSLRLNSDPTWIVLARGFDYLHTRPPSSDRYRNGMLNGEWSGVYLINFDMPVVSEWNEHLYAAPPVIDWSCLEKLDIEEISSIAWHRHYQQLQNLQQNPTTTEGSHDGGVYADGMTSLTRLDFLSVKSPSSLDSERDLDSFPLSSIMHEFASTSLPFVVVDKVSFDILTRKTDQDGFSAETAIMCLEERCSRAPPLRNLLRGSNIFQTCTTHGASTDMLRQNNESDVMNTSVRRQVPHLATNWYDIWDGSGVMGIPVHHCDRNDEPASPEIVLLRYATCRRTVYPHLICSGCHTASSQGVELVDEPMCSSHLIRSSGSHSLMHAPVEQEGI